ISYESIQPLYQHIRKVHPDARTPIIIVGNKADLLHARQVQTKDGLQLANELGSLFLEISTSESSHGVCDVFQYLCKEVSKLHHSSSTDKRRSSIIPRPKSPNMQDLKRPNISKCCFSAQHCKEGTKLSLPTGAVR
uniref:small monomeric GTPase n=1 Tax=Dromaius novaehollandiae TaxID=8790 RepID=A0A8C4JC24_DRONO